MKPLARRWWRSRATAWVAALAALLLVFAAYLQPDMAFELAARVWSCF
jgi:hypothetical protein